MKMSSFGVNTELGQGASPSNKTSVFERRGSSADSVMEFSGFVPYLAPSSPLPHNWFMGESALFQKDCEKLGLSGNIVESLLGS